MRFAYDKVLAKLVSADAARNRTRTGDIAGRYRCPNPICKAPVTVKGRYWRDPYFAHLHYQAAANCDEYHPGTGDYDYSYTRPVARLNEREQLSRPGLQLHVNAKSWDWKLSYYLPRHELTADHFFITVEPGSQPKRISTSALRTRPLQFSVVPSTEPIGYVTTSESDERIDGTYFSPRTFHLKTPGLTVFHAAGLSDHRAVGSTLYWGSSYFAIWKEDVNVKLPERLVVKSLRNQRGWCCALIALPTTPSEALKQLLEHLSDMLVRAKMAAINVVYPHPSQGDEIGALCIDPADAVVLSVSRSAAEPLKAGILVESRDGLATFDVDDSPETFVILRQRAADTYYFIRYADEPAVLIHARTGLIGAPTTQVLLETQGTDGAKVLTEFFSMHAHNLLASIRRGNKHPTRLVVNGCVEGSLFQRVDGKWFRTPINHVQHDRQLAPLKAVDIQRLVGSRNSEVHLDLGGYGYQFVSSRTGRRSTNAIDIKWATQARWLLVMANKLDRRTSEALTKVQRGDPRELIEILRLLAVPDHLQIHLNNLVNAAAPR
jgi:hypothetical protein